MSKEVESYLSNFSAEVNTSGKRKFSRLHSSCRLFCTAHTLEPSAPTAPGSHTHPYRTCSGVPVSRMAFSKCIFRTTCDVSACDVHAPVRQHPACLARAGMLEA
jgi:hypothetical protein